MERKPFGLSEAVYSQERERLLQSLSSEELGIFRLLENMWNLEQTSKNKSRLKHEMIWQRATMIEEILYDVLTGRKEELPVPNNPGRYRYETFDWVIKSNGQTVARFDIRIMPDHIGFLLRAPSGDLSKVDKEIKALVGNIEYPFKVVDDRGYLFKNEVYQQVP